MIHTYNVRSAWALLAFGLLTSDKRFQQAALRNIRWTLSQQLECGFFVNNAFKPGGNANTHGTAYVLRGLLQSYQLTGKVDLLAAVLRAAEPIISQYTAKGWIASELGPKWQYRSSHICLTGYSQLAIVFYHLSVLTAESKYASAAERLLGAVASTQNTNAPASSHYGAIAGSFPFYGSYAPLQYPNWATKFFIDAVLLKRRIASGRFDLFDYELHSG